MIRWLRLVLPPGWIFVAAGLVYVALQTITLLEEWFSDFPLFSMESPATGVVIMLAIGYGLYRVWVFHPGFRPGYYGWLRTTPWTSRQPLPLGPIHLVGQDILVVTILLGLNWPRLRMESLHLIQAFLLAYLATMTLTLLFTGQKFCAYLIGFGLGLMVLFWFNFPLSLFFGGAVYVIAFNGLRRSQAGFPWEDSDILQKLLQFLKMNLSGQEQRMATDQGSLGWPYARLGPGFSGRPKVSLADTLLLGLLVGWWFFVMEYHLDAMSNQTFKRMSAGAFSILIIILLAMGGASCRLLIYCLGYFPPISLMGRLTKGRFLIPGYDKVFAAPLLALLIASAAMFVGFGTALEPSLTFAVAVALIVWVLLGVGPGLDRWHLTGEHRLTPTGLKAQMR